MKAPFITVMAIVLLGALYVTLPIVLDYFQRYRHKRVLRCPESGGLAEVDIHALRAAFSSLRGKPLLRVRNCTLWPRKKGCTEGCLRQ